MWRVPPLTVSIKIQQKKTATFQECTRPRLDRNSLYLVNPAQFDLDQFWLTKEPDWIDPAWSDIFLWTGPVWTISK